MESPSIFRNPKEFAMNRLFLMFILCCFSLAKTAEAKSILLMGDSHSVGPFGRTLDSLLRKLPDAQVRTVGSCGSIIRWFYTGTPTSCGSLQIDRAGKISEATKAPTPLVQEMIAAEKPDLMIIELGANYMVGYPEATLTRDVERLLEDVEAIGARCLWVSPPDSRKYRDQRKILVARLEKLVKDRCQWFDSLQHTRYPDTGGDGVHYNTSALNPIAKEWARQVAGAAEAL